MGEVSREIEQAVATLHLDYDIIHLTESQFNENLYYSLLEKFVEGKDRRWWWEAFKDSFSFSRFDYPPAHLNKIIPDFGQNVWFMVEDVHESFYPIYDVNPAYINAILGECFGFEYYIIDKKQTWLLCENHHKSLIGVGDFLKQHNSTIIEV